MQETAVNKDWLSFKAHVKDLYKKTSHKMFAQPKNSPYMGLPRIHNFFNVYCKFQFIYCPLAWMCQLRRSSNKKGNSWKMPSDYLWQQTVNISRTFTKGWIFLYTLPKSTNISNWNVQNNQGFGTGLFFKCFWYKPNYNLLHVSHFDIPLVNSVSKELKVSQFWKPKFEI